MRPKLWWILGLSLLLVVLVVLILAFSWSRSGLPVRSGERPLAGLEAEVAVRFDRLGVPHVLAASETDAAAALGYLHANDRLTQMELGRRAAAGRLSEILGGATVGVDVYFRTLRLGPAAERLLAAAEPRTRRLLEAYAGGVNAWLRERGNDLPPDLRLLRAEPEPWRPQDSVAFALLMAEDLSFWNGRPEEARFRWLRAFGPDRLRDLLGEPDLHVPEEIAELARRDGPPPSGPSPTDADVAAPGSNNWAVGPSQAAGGRPMVANDPHLGLGLPSLWYQVHLRAPGFEAAGMTLPGAPGVVLGRGPHLAWAFTNTMLDDHDLFFERLDDSGENYWRDGGWQPLEVVEETITVRGAEPQTVTLRATDRGPLLEADADAGLPARSLAWTVYEEGDPLAALRDLSQARTVEEVTAAIDSYVCPAQNLVVAFASGELFLTVLGRVPARKVGDAGPATGAGRLPSPGWAPAYGWEGLRPRETNPTVRSPADDRLVTANDDIRPAGYPLSWTADVFPPNRAGRIAEILSGRSDWDVPGFAELQLDVESHHARDLVAALAGDYDGEAGTAYDALAGWDFQMERRGPAALFALLERRLLQAVFGDEAEEAGLRPFAGSVMLLRILRGDMDAGWFDDVRTPEVEGRRDMLSRALSEAWKEGRERWGDDVASWNYGRLHTLTLRHALDGAPVFGRWARRGPFEMPGSDSTVAAFGGVWRGDRQHVVQGPSMRWIVDWSQPERAFAALPGGQSGHPADPHYDDRLEPYLEGRLDPAAWSEAAIAEATVRTLRLRPAAE